MFKVVCLLAYVVGCANGIDASGRTRRTACFCFSLCEPCMAQGQEDERTRVEVDSERASERASAMTSTD